MSTFFLFILLVTALILVLGLISAYPLFFSKAGIASSTNANSAKENTESHTTAKKNNNQNNHKNKDKNNSLLSLNVSLFKQRLAELEEDRQASRVDAQEYAELKTELQRQLLQASEDLRANTQHIKDADTYANNIQANKNHKSLHKKIAFMVLVWLSVLSMGAYLFFDNRTEVFKLWEAKNSPKITQTAQGLLSGKLQEPPKDFYADVIDDPKKASERTIQLLQVMQTMVHENAGNATYWLNLSKGYVALQQKPEAIESLARAYRLAPQNTEIAMTYAQSRFFEQGGQLDEQSKKIALDILKNTPEHEGAQMLMAMGEVKAENFAQADYWVARLKRTITEKSGADSSALLSLNKLSEVIAAKRIAVANGVKVQVKVAGSLLAKLPQSISANATLFVIARPEAGGAPYAVKRLPASMLLKQSGQTLFFTLTDSESMLASRTLSVAKRDKIPLVLTARISNTGNAISQKGDYYAQTIPLSFKEANQSTKKDEPTLYHLLIDRQK